MFDLFQFLHVLTMFAAVAAATGPELTLHAVARTRNVEGIRTFAGVIKPLGRAVPALFVLGLAFGLLAAATGGIDFFRPWLVASYVVFAIAMTVGATLSGPWAERLGRAAVASPTDVPSGELEAAIHDGRGMISTVVLMSAIVTIVFLMVVKPGL